jgi:hypothetical protein
LSLLRLLLLILRRGRWHSRGRDFSQERAQVLRRLTGKPSAKAVSRWHGTWWWKNAVLRMMITQAAYLRRCITTRGGHLSHPSSRVAYVRLPKSASTSLSASMLQPRYPNIQVAQLTSSEINFLADACLQYQFESGIEYFTVVRHPLVRLASVYRDFFLKQRDTDFIYEDYLFGILRRDMSFAEFVRTIAAIPDFLKDQHLKPQTTLLRYYEQKTSVRVFKLEDMPALQDYLQHLHLSLPHLNVSGDQTTSVLFDTDTLAIACGIYQDDLKRWNYAVDHLSP